ncbi:lysine--tRNA ligase [Candidatus Woesearchaeota archaeon CG10_big_fil_rev_8_21_14_0_10_36_11]|nr:MAG: lysine--tRNA ligase [Candidatus Woesearchaeota archaeon CG10_big_fil_rev_8_21_14_0_10_36_11]
MASQNTAAHWAENYADQIIRMKGDRKTYVVESGITPSGVIHAGNFREVITCDLIRRALERKGKKVTFLYIWDDYDVLRKVPVNLPEQKMIEDNLRKPVFNVPDPFGCHDSYANHFEKVFEAESARVGIDATFVYNHKNYLKCVFAEEIKIALEHTQDIKDILNVYRKEPLTDDWLPIFVFCETCGKDTIKNIQWNGEYTVTYTCECGHADTIDFRKKGIVTLRWRVDWPMRWHHNNVDFESAGKDHFAAGGSVDTGRRIQEKVYGTEHPFGFAYEWIGVKGQGQFSSSKGNVVTVSELLEIYEPEIVRYLFAGTRPNKEFAISFDTDVLAMYEEFDRCERIYFGLENVNDKIREKNTVAYELSHIGKISKTVPYQSSFRHLTMLLQIHNFDIDKVIGYFERELKNEYDKERVRIRAACAKNWILKYAPDDFKFTVQQTFTGKLEKKEKEVLHELSTKLVEKEWTDVALHEEMYVLCTNHGILPKDFFKAAYMVLIGKEKGPRLASFILEIGRKNVAELFTRV